jgi:hypothetical protein
MRKIFFCVAGLFLFFKASACAENIAVIVNSESPIFLVKAAPALNDIKEIYLGKVKYWKGAAIKPVNMKDKAMLNRFVEKTCGMHLSEYQNYWVKAAVESGLEAPKVVETSKEVISFVQREKTGVGYVLESEAIGIEEIKIVTLISE